MAGIAQLGASGVLASHFQTCARDATVMAFNAPSSRPFKACVAPRLCNVVCCGRGRRGSNALAELLESKKATETSLCPCGTGDEYEKCCEKFIEGKAKPDTAEQLMRSRFSAYVKQEWKYILDTTHPESSEWNAESVRLPQLMGHPHDDGPDVWSAFGGMLV